MADTFNPYHEWLGIDERIEKPNLFQLLGVDETEENTEVIAVAAERAQTRVRSFRPGTRAAQWAGLLDELSAAKRELLDPEGRRTAGVRMEQAGPVGQMDLVDPMSPMARDLPTPYLPTPYLPPPYSPPTAYQPLAGPTTANPCALPGPMAAMRAAPLALPVASLAVPVPLATPVPTIRPEFVGPSASAKSGPLLAPDSPAEMAALPRRSANANSSRVMVAERARRQAYVPLVIGLAVVLTLGAFGLLALGLGKSKRDQVSSTSNHPVSVNDGKRSPRGPATEPSTSPRRSTTGSLPKPGPSTTVAIADDSATRPTANPADPNMPQPATPNTAPVPKPEMKPEPEPRPEPQPEPTPQPEAKPDPTPKPILKPATSLERKPEPPATAPPTKDEVLALAKALTTARTALSEQNVDIAQQELAKVEQLNMLAEHARKYRRLREVAHNVGEFRLALVESTKALQGGQVITVGSTVVAVVETLPGQDRIILRVAGMNRNYRFSDLPVGLAVAIADMWLAKDKASTHVVKASFVAMHRNATDEMKDKAKQWLELARGELAEPVQTVLLAMSDSYDFEQDFESLGK